MNALSGTVLILDDDADVCRSLERLFTTRNLSAQGFTRPEDLLAVLPLNEPACPLLDIRLGSTDGFALMDTLKTRQQELPVVCLTAYGDLDSAVAALRRHVEDYHIKPYDPDALVQSVRNVLERAMAVREASARHEHLAARMRTLRKREREVLNYAASGLLNKQIAVRMGISEITVKMHRGRAMRMLGIGTAAELARYAAFLDIDPETSPPAPETRQPRRRKGDR